VAAESGLTLEATVKGIVGAYMTALDADGASSPMKESWTQLSATVIAVLAELDALTSAQPIGAAPSGLPASRRQQARAAAAEEATVYLSYLQDHPANHAAPSDPRDSGDSGNDASAGSARSAKDAGDGVGRIAYRLLGLYVSVRAVLPVLAEIEQQVELIQVSADTRSLLAARRATAAQKLTGVQVHNFGAFYKASWRGNDWLWGRLDGCGWMVHILLDPRRILEVLQNDGAAEGGYRNTFANRLAAAINAGPVPADALTELAYLDDRALPIPTSLPALSMWVAQYGQQGIADRELPVLAGLIRDTGEGPTSPAEVNWLVGFDQTFGPHRSGDPTLADTARLLEQLPVPEETLAQEQSNRTPLFLRTLTQTGAVATAAATAIRNPPASLRPTFATARTVTRTAYAATDAAGGARATTVWVGLLLMALGVAGLLTNSVLGIAGLVAAPAGALLLAVCLGRPVWKMAQIFVALLVVFVAALPWFPQVGEPFFTWLSTRASWASVSSMKWLWVVLLLLVLLPAFSTLADLVWRRRRRPRTDPAQHAGPPVAPPPASTPSPAKPPDLTDGGGGETAAEPVIVARSQQPTTNPPKE
jgi:hypothetical protein